MKQEEVIRKNAEIFMKKISLIDVLEEHGTPLITGSYALHTMVWNDIDLQLQPYEGLNHKEVMSAIIKHFIKNTTLEKLNYIDFYVRQKPQMPKGLYVGLNLKGDEGEDWKIDIWILDKDDMDINRKFIKFIKDEMTEEMRSIILQLKFAMTEKYGRPPNMASYYIYQAVVDHKLTEKRDILAYLGENNVKVEL